MKVRDGKHLALNFHENVFLDPGHKRLVKIGTPEVDCLWVELDRIRVFLKRPNTLTFEVPIQTGGRADRGPGVYDSSPETGRERMKVKATGDTTEVKVRPKSCTPEAVEAQL